MASPLAQEFPVRVWFPPQLPQSIVLIEEGQRGALALGRRRWLRHVQQPASLVFQFGNAEFALLFFLRRSRVRLSFLLQLGLELDLALAACSVDNGAGRRRR